MDHQDWETVILSKERKYTPQEIKDYEEKQKEKLEKKRLKIMKSKFHQKLILNLKKLLCKHV